MGKWAALIAFTVATAPQAYPAEHMLAAVVAVERVAPAGSVLQEAATDLRQRVKRLDRRADMCSQRDLFQTSERVRAVWRASWKYGYLSREQIAVVLVDIEWTALVWKRCRQGGSG